MSAAPIESPADDGLGEYLIDFVERHGGQTISLNASSVDCVMVAEGGGVDIHFKSGLGIVVCGTQAEVAALINLAVVAGRSPRRRR